MFWNVAIYKSEKNFTLCRPSFLQWGPGLHLDSSTFVFLLNRSAPVGKVHRTSSRFRLVFATEWVQVQCAAKTCKTLWLWEPFRFKTADLRTAPSVYSPLNSLLHVALCPAPRRHSATFLSLILSTCCIANSCAAARPAPAFLCLTSYQK